LFDTAFVFRVKKNQLEKKCGKVLPQRTVSLPERKGGKGPPANSTKGTPRPICKKGKSTFWSPRLFGGVPLQTKRRPSMTFGGGELEKELKKEGGGE